MGVLKQLAEALHGEGRIGKLGEQREHPLQQVSADADVLQVPLAPAEPATEDEEVVLEVAGAPGQRDAPLYLAPGHLERLLQLVHVHEEVLLRDLPDDGAIHNTGLLPRGHADVDHVPLAQVQEEVLELLQVRQVLREADDVLAEAGDAGALAGVPEVADADLHVVQGDEHRLDERGVVEEIL